MIEGSSRIWVLIVAFYYRASGRDYPEHLSNGYIPLLIPYVLTHSYGTHILILLLQTLPSEPEDLYLAQLDGRNLHRDPPRHFLSHTNTFVAPFAFAYTLSDAAFADSPFRLQIPPCELGQGHIVLCQTDHRILIYCNTQGRIAWAFQRLG